MDSGPVQNVDQPEMFSRLFLLDIKAESRRGIGSLSVSLLLGLLAFLLKLT